MPKYFYTFYFGMFFNEKKISNVSMKRYTEIGSPWRAPFYKLIYWVVVLPFITHESCSFNIISTHVIKFLPNFLKTELRKSWFEITLDKIFVSTFNKEICLQFLMYRLSRSFFSMSLITASLF